MEWSGKTSSYSHKHGDAFDGRPLGELSDKNKAVRKVTVLDAQWSTCPEEVYKEVQELWRWAEHGNDDYIHKTTIADLSNLGSEDYPYVVEKWYWGETEEEKKGWIEEPGSVKAIIQYLEEQGVGPDEVVWIHYWW